MRFGFINHYLNVRLIQEQLGRVGLPFVPEKMVEQVMPYLPPRRSVELGPLTSLCRAQTAGIGIVVPLLPYHFLTLPASRVIKKVTQAVKMAKGWGAEIVGLGGFTSICCDEGAEIADDVSVALTSGNTLTAVLAIDGIRHAAKIMGLNLKASHLSVIGATGDIGSICTRILAKQVKTVTLCARNEERLHKLAEELSARNLAEINVNSRVKEAIRDADLVLSCTSALTTVIEPQSLKPGAIVCDVAYPADVGRDLREHRNDVLVFEGGLTTFPDPLCKGATFLNHFAPAGMIHGCLAETIVLSLENRRENFSMGRGKITEEKISEMRIMADRNGFSLAPFYYNGATYSIEELDRIASRARDMRAVVSGGRQY